MSELMKVKPVQLIIVLSNGKKIELEFSEPKPSRVSGRTNCNAISKMVLNGHMIQVGCNLTVLD